MVACIHSFIVALVLNLDTAREILHYMDEITSVVNNIEDAKC